MSNNGDLSLTVSKELVVPILEAKIKAALTAAMGGEQEILNKILDSVIHQKVNSEGKIGHYPSDNKYDWFDIVITKTIQDEIKESIKEEVKLQGKVIKDAVRKYLKTASGSNAIARALVDGLEKSFENNWRNKFNIEFKLKE